MSGRARVADAVLWGLVLGLIVAAGGVDPATVSAQRFWGDGATYFSMTWSLVADGDLRYEAKDVARVRREYPSGPQGIFLKRSSGGLTWDSAAGFPWVRRVRADEKRVYFAKSAIYPLVAAPFVLALGSRGFMVCNAALFGGALLLAFYDFRRSIAPWAAVVATLGLFTVTVTPVYVVWLAPEIFNFAAILASLVALRRGRPGLSAILLAAAVYSKPYNLLIAIPLGLMPFFERERGSFLRRLAESARRGLVLAGATALLFGLNIAITGEANYQGGERKTFHAAQFPFEGRVTFGNSGEWMGADQLGPKAEGQREDFLGRTLSFIGVAVAEDRDAPTASVAGATRPRWMASEMAVSPEEIRQAFPLNAVYFWVGRFGGAALYFAPIVVAAVLFLARGPRGASGWLAVLALGVSYLFYIRVMPDNWYGGSGTLGNRYFMNLLPLVVLIAPRGREFWTAIGGALMGGAFIVPLLASPLRCSLWLGQHTLLPQYRVAPLDLTMLNDLSLFGEPWRKKQAFGDIGTEGPKGRPPAPDAYYLYFPDDSTYGREDAHGGSGFWLRGGREGEVVLRTLAPIRTLTVRLLGGPRGDRVRVRVGARSERLALRAGEARALDFELGPGVLYHGDRLHILRFRSADGTVVNDPMPRRLGTFVRLELAPPSPIQ